MSALRLFLVLSLVGCSREEPPFAAPATSSRIDAPPAATASTAPEPSPSAASPGPGELPSSPEYLVAEGDAPQLYALAQPTYVYDLPDTAKRKLGWLRPGGAVRRAEKPVAISRRCRDGWYRIAPRGFVCAGTETTEDPNHPLVLALGKPPARGEPLPYLYARSRGNPPFLYAKIPSPREQRATEGESVGERIESASRYAMLQIAGEPSALPSFLEGGKVLPRPLNQQRALRSGVHRGLASYRSSFAFASVFDAGGRLFGLSTDADLVALDRVKLVRATAIHGGEVRDLPAAIATRPLARFRLVDGKVTADGFFDAWATLSLTGRVEGELVEESGGAFVAKPQVVLPRRTSFPKFAEEGGEKWLDIDIGTQTLVAYEGRRAVYVALVSTGAAGTGDPETTPSTVQGYFRIQTKHVTATMTGNRADVDEYELGDVPYVQYFQGSYALHAAFWHERFGHPHSHGCVNLTPRDAAWIFAWTEPNVPASWHGVDAAGAGTIVYVHG